MKMMTWSKVKWPAGVGIEAVLICSVTTVAVSQTGGGDKLTADEIAAKSRAAKPVPSSYTDTGKVVSEMAGQKNTLSFNNRLQRPIAT